MTPIQLVFLFVAFATLWAAFMVVTRNNLVHAALFLVIALFGVAVLFVMLEAGFLAVIQVLVYIGAIAILMIFAVMLTRGDVDDIPDITNRYAGWVGLVAVLFFSSLVILMAQWPSFTALAKPILSSRDTIVELGTALVSPNGYVIPFEVASVMLLAALIGALVVARPRKGK
ncbi:MAG: NADH-quinone oxidoreductase subunit J [Chloroflexi bacterium]|nr:NADH-quinone oxidoreductase subunit J [Chloroflexota bacterium]